MIIERSQYMNSTSAHDPLANPRERRRRANLQRTLSSLRHLIVDRAVLDYGASSGLSMMALLDAGAAEVVGIEPDHARVQFGLELLAGRAVLIHTPDTRQLPFGPARFDTVLCNAVLEHIPQPRDAYIAEMWRILKPGGHLIVNETPNKYLPRDYHTTHLWGVPWLPARTAYWYARWWGVYRKSFEQWQSSGWRGLGFFELVRPLVDWSLVPERSKLRHRILTALHIPASLFDPYPCWILRKVA